MQRNPDEFPFFPVGKALEVYKKLNASIEAENALISKEIEMLEKILNISERELAFKKEFIGEQDEILKLLKDRCADNSQLREKIRTVTEENQILKDIIKHNTNEFTHKITSLKEKYVILMQEVGIQIKAKWGGIHRRMDLEEGTLREEIKHLEDKHRGMTHKIETMKYATSMQFEKMRMEAKKLIQEAILEQERKTRQPAPKRKSVETAKKVRKPRKKLNLEENPTAPGDGISKTRRLCKPADQKCHFPDYKSDDDIEGSSLLLENLFDDSDF